jgi:trk system potassium uptake protein TrkH
MGLDLTTFMILTGSAVLIPLGAICFAVTEGNGLLAGRPFGEQLLMCLFQGNTPRTAGFSMLDYAEAGRATLFTQMGLMLVGAAPGGTAGGMKITAVWIFAATLWARVVNRDQVLILRRAIPLSAIRQAMIVCVSMVLLHGAFTATIACLQPRLSVEAIAFEVASALGTVGLSTGITPQLEEPSRVLIALTMFIGRLGPLGFVYALVRVRPVRTSVRYPQADVCVG